MSLIKGMTVILVDRTQTGVDIANRPIYSETEIPVDNVLVAQPTTDDITSSVDLTGKKAEYVLGIPKGDTHNWKDKRVRFFGKTWRVLGYPIEGIEANVPLDWHKKVMVATYE